MADIDPALVILAGFTACIVVAALIGGGHPRPPLTRFRFSQPPELILHCLWLREDSAPGAPFRLLAAGPKDTSPRAGYGHNALADIGLAHTEAAAALVTEFAPSALSALYSRRASIEATLDPPSRQRYSGATSKEHTI